MPAPVISVRNLGKQYRLGEKAHDTLRDQIAGWLKKPSDANGSADSKRKTSEIMWALRDVSFEVCQGDVVGIVGRNGAGKSTLLKILSQITEPSTGEIRIKGRMASLLEVGTGFHHELTGRENIFLNGSILGMTKADIKKKFDEIVAFAEVEKFLDTPVKHYSSGMYVRLAFAVAAHLDPDILLVDEVLAVGDASFQAKCMTKMDDVATKQGRTVLFVSHNMAAVQRMCNKGVYLEGGRVKELGTITKVLDAYQRSIEQHISGGVALSELKSGEVRFVKWALQGKSSDQSHTCYTRETCEFVITIASRAELNDVKMSFILWNLEGELVIAGNTLANKMPLFKISEGTHQLKVKVRLPIKAGLYQLEMSLNSATRGEIERCYLEPKLNILPQQTALPEKWQGMITEEVEFEFTPCTP